jgi:hypothetical protein
MRPPAQFRPHNMRGLPQPAPMPPPGPPMPMPVQGGPGLSSPPPLAVVPDTPVANGGMPPMIAQQRPPIG